MTVQTISRAAATRDDLTAQGLWDFYDRLEAVGYDVRIESAPATDRHLTVHAEDGSVFKVTGYGKDDLTLRRYADHGAYEADDARGVHASLSEDTVLDVLHAITGTDAGHHLLRSA